jgi:hypothetical protein
MGVPPEPGLFIVRADCSRFRYTPGNMIDRDNSGFGVHSSAFVAAAACLLAAGCSAPPGADSGDGDVPSYGAYTAPANPGSAAAAAPSGSTGQSPAPTGAGGSTSAPSSEPSGNSNLGLQPAQNGSQGGGQPAAAGGASAAGNDPNANGAAGSNGDPVSPVPGSPDGAMGNAGSTSMPPSDGSPQQPQEPAQQPQEPPQQPQQPAGNGNPAQEPGQPPQEPVGAAPPAPPPPSGDCNGAFFCDGFESVASGESPTAALWTIIQSFAPAEQSELVLVSNANARTGTQALRVIGADNGGRNGVRATLPQSNYFVRAFVQIDTVTRGTVFIGAGTNENDETRFRVQGDDIATINTVSGPLGDPVRPANANGGDCPDCVALTPNEWVCVELAIDNAAQTATLFVNDVQAAVAGADAFAPQPAAPNVFIGSWGLQGGVSSVWIDDVAIGPQRFGCD